MNHRSHGPRHPCLGGFALLLVAVLSRPDVAAAATGGPDAAGYTWYDINSGCTVQSDVFQTANSGSFVAGTPTEFFIGPLDLGFNFPFYDRIVSQIWIHQSGLIFFQAPPAGANLWVNQPIPRTRDGASGFLAAYWTWMQANGGPDVWWESFSADGYFKISASQIPQDSSSPPPAGRVDMEIYLYKNGDIRIEYLSPSDGWAATIGMESFTEATGLQMRYNATQTNGMTYGSPTPFSICIQRKRDLSCAAATPITCGTPVNGASPASVPTNVLQYGCGGAGWAAKEKVYRLDITQLCDVNVTLSNYGTRVMAAWLLDACDEWSCVAGGTNVFTALSVTPGTYYLVVDGAQARDEGAFTLQADCVSISIPITCEETLSGSTLGAPNRISGWNCVAPGDFTGPDRVYQVNFTPPGNLTASLTSATGQSVFIMSGSRPLVGTNCLAGGVGGAVLYDPAPGPYFIVVDGPPGSGGAFNLSLTCAPIISCSPGAGPLTCQQRISSSTVGLSPFVDFYRCTPNPYDGPEAVYTFTNPSQQVVSFLLDSVDPRLDVFILDSCNEAACNGVGDTEVSADLAPGTYYVVVDGREGASSAFTLSSICGFGLEPAVLSLNGGAGQCFNEEKTAWLTPELVRADVLLSIDLTGSMGGELNEVQNNLQAIIDSLQAFIPDVQLGLVSYMDYPASGNYSTPGCVYNSNYGGFPDYPYRLDHPITADRAALQAALDALVIGGGGDGPESYNRVLYEAVNDPGIGWRAGSRRIVVDFGDEMPHDCDVLACLGGGGGSRGLDLGRDGVANTADDLSTDAVVQGLVDSNTVLIHFDSSGGGFVGAFSYVEVWNCWAQRTGGSAEAINGNGTVPPDVGGIDCDPTTRPDCLAELVAVRIQEQGSYCSDLKLVAEPGYESWLVDGGTVYTSVRLPTSVTFSIQFCVPPGTPPGPYDFTVQLLCGGQVVTTQSVHVDVVVECAPSVVSTPQDQTLCEGGSATLDASGMTVVNCTGGTASYAWTDSLGNSVGTTPSITVSPAATETYTVDVTCSTIPSCGTSASATVTVHLPPLFSGLSATDPASCNLGLELTWPSATFRDPSGSGSYNVYRSETSCADAMTRPPIARGITALRWVDTTTRDARSYYYVVQAEDGRVGTVCPQGPNNGGAVNTGLVCFGPVTEVADPTYPAGLGWTLRASHVGDTVTFTWPGTRALRPGEHFHVLKGLDEAQPYPKVNPEGQLTTTWVDVDTVNKLQFFDIRIANTCEVESEDDEPPFYGR